jgi:hypothetical protein
MGESPASSAGAVRRCLRPRLRIRLQAWRDRHGPHESPYPRRGARDWGWCGLGPPARRGNR